MAVCNTSHICFGILMISMIIARTTSFSFQSLENNSRSFTTTQLLCASSPSSDSSDLVIRLPLLQAQLADTSCDDKNRQDLQSQIDQTKMAAEFGVRKVQLEFYEAFSSQDSNKMRKVWSSSNSCKCVHPGMTCITGAEAILNSWQVLFGAEPFEIVPKETSVDICGSTAICHCVESIGTSSKLEAVNIYKREGGAWKMTMHIASPVIGLQ